MAASVTFTPTPERVGMPITIAATGFALTHAITLSVTGPDGTFAASESGTTDGTGAFTWTNTLTPTEPGVLYYTVSDGTSVVSGSVQVWEGGE